MTIIRITKEQLATGRPVSQGEVNIWAVEYAPESVRNQMAGLKSFDNLQMVGDGSLILGHSETGHHHVLEAEKTATIWVGEEELTDEERDRVYRIFKIDDWCALKHCRDYDAHDTFIFPAGNYIRGIREEQSPEGWRRVAD